jgi:uncharacterized lipoprotein YmbA
MRRLLALVGVLAAGCASAPPEQEYTLSVEAAGQPVVDMPDASIAVGAARLGDLYDRPQLVVRESENRVNILEQQRWAEPLKAGIPRVIAGDLARLLGTTHTTSYPRGELKDLGYRVALEVQRFDARPGEVVDVEIAWSVHRLRDGAVRQGRSAVRESAASGYEALVAAQSRALASVSAEIASAIASLR